MEKRFLISAPFIFFGCIAFGQQRVMFNLFELSKQQKLEPVHLSIEALEEDNYKGVKLSEDASEGLVWIKGASFSKGSIEFDARGKDEFQKSFIGIAFHGQNDSTYDAIYFRPFNFHTKDSVRRIHAVQYVSHPVFTWRKLRDDKTTNAKFEKAIDNAPDPNGWFHVKVLVKDKTVKVFINDRKEPELTIQQLSNFSSGKIGLFAGDGSGGAFANLVIE
jgi:hypothetical protein